MRRKRKIGENMEGQLKKRDIEMQRQGRFEKVQKSRWNKWYKEVRT